MASPAEQRAALAAALATIGGLRVHATWPGVVVPDAALVLNAGRGRQLTFSGGVVQRRYRLLLLLPTGSMAESLLRLDEYQAEAGARSVEAALLADATLKDVLLWFEWGPQGDFAWATEGGNAERYVSATAELELLAG